MKKFWFTFGHSQQWGPMGYHVIEAKDENAARLIMIKRFGSKWSMCYKSAEAAGVKDYGLSEITTERHLAWLKEERRVLDERIKSCEKTIRRIDDGDG